MNGSIAASGTPGGANVLAKREALSKSLWLARRTIQGQKMAPLEAVSFSLAPAAKKRPTQLKAFEKASVAWSEVVKETSMNQQQQQVILGAIYDAQLYFAEVERIEAEWASEVARDPSARDTMPFPEVDWTTDVNDAVLKAARDVLTPEQYETFEDDYISKIVLEVGSYMDAK